MTVRRIGVGIWIVLVTGCMIAAKSFLSVVLFLATMVVLLFCVVSVAKSKRTCKLTIEAPKQMRQNQKKSVKLSVKNLGAYQLFSVRGVIVCRNELTQETVEAPFSCSVNAYMTEKIPIKINSAFLGRVVISVKDLAVYDLLGILCQNLPSDSVTGVTLVLPVESAEEENAGGEQAQGTGHRNADELFGVKEYEEGMPVRNVHWKLSGKLDRLMIRETVKQSGTALRLFLETDLSPEYFKDLPQEASARAEQLIAVSRQLASEGTIHRIVYYEKEKDCFREHEIQSMDDLSGALDALLSVTFFSEEGYGTLRRYVSMQENASHILYLTDQGAEKFGEWMNEQGITPVYWEENK